MLGCFKKCRTKKPNDFKFTKTGYLLSKETLSEYEYIKRLFISAITTLRKYNEQTDLKCDSVEELKKLVVWYENSDTLITSLIRELFNQRFIETIDKRLSIFELLDKILKMFYIFDMHRFRSTRPFHDFSRFKVKNRARINEREIVKLSVFSSLAMPMGRLFMSYFTMDNFEIFHPVFLKKRSTIFINDIRKDFLSFICTVLVAHTNYKYLKMYACALNERLTKRSQFDSFFEELTVKEKNYYIDLVNLI